MANTFNYKSFLVYISLAIATAYAQDHRTYADYCAEGNWRSIQELLENGYRPHFKIVTKLLSEKDRKRYIVRYLCSVVVIYNALYMARNSALPPHPIAHDTHLIELILSILYGSLLSGIEMTILSNQPKLSTGMLHQTLQWLAENDPRQNSIAGLVRNQQLGQQPLEYFLFYLADENTLQHEASETTVVAEKKYALVDTGSFDMQSGMYNPNFMCRSTYELCKREHLASSAGFEFTLPAKFVDDLDAYLFGIDNPFTREQRKNIDIDKIDLIDKCTQMPLAVPKKTAQALCHRFKTELAETELDSCSDEVLPTHYSLPKLASVMRSHRQ